MTQTLYTIGYGSWPTKKRIAGMLDALEHNRVKSLVDIRHSPCASDPSASGNYSARDWNLQAHGGIEEHLNSRGIEYRWIMELGNPQKRDREMKIMRAHLESKDDRWPAVRGLRMLAEMVRDSELTFCLLCACAEYGACHRHLVAEKLNALYFSHALRTVDLTKSGATVVG
ncbi:MAG: DUF488 domain-containing protein [Planctomycetales bacterium]|nr:DUF488 domain-containing protein [Planctomycetales bacterium]